MQRLRWLVSFAVVSAVSVAGSESRSFYDTLTSAERQAAGLAELTPPQQAALSALADRWVERQAQEAIDRARTKAVAEVRAEVKAEQVRNVGLRKPVAAAEQVIRTRIAGTFRGWSKGARFSLENGQVWVVDDEDSRYFPRRENAEVELRPSTFGGWKLTLLPDGLWVRVKRVQ
jgi:hypothetical protein